MSDRTDAYEDAWLDWLPYWLSGIVGCGITGLSVGSMLFGIVWMTVTGTWSNGVNGWFAAAFVMGIILTIVCGVGWIFLLPEIFEQYKKWRKAKRRYEDSKG